MIQNHSDRDWDVIIIGAGAAGLTASVYLAQAGKSVLMLEKGTHPGGRAISTEMAGARVNLGAHALFRSALDILQEIGVTVTGSAPKPPGLLMFKEEDGHVRAVPLTQLLLGSFLTFHEKIQLIRFYSRLRKTDTSTLHTVTLQAYLESQLASLRVRSVVEGLFRLSTYCEDPELLSAGAAVEQLQQGQVMYIDGGWQTLVNKLVEKAQKTGVCIRASSPVREIRGSSPDMCVVLKDGTELRTRQVLSTAGPEAGLSLLHPALSAEEAAAYEQHVPVYAACLDLVVSGMPRPKIKFVIGANVPWYYANHSAAAALSGPGKKVIHVMKYLPAHDQSDPKQNELELEGFLDSIQPEWRKHVIQQRFLPRMLVSHGMAMAANGGLSRRPGPEVKGRPGLYMAGDWVGSQGLLLNASLNSAKEASKQMIAQRE
ncbi:phytoene desaturase family protein [Paenibacillus lemnae]|uniref:NAD(P)/FAD-dependent oxidoreductase n=1 Tax=Paenibacillus lemnae TaxID=1330551 RepID=A0A848M377_PAELE|nr:NAD(P)/FAD-dependent oxidoreductase [Paenibacillus lemnae]NMO94303.1 NAD(P)/FAD-dependent oxidoreductase [Paenibacillus lemnae]